MKTLKLILIIILTQPINSFGQSIELKKSQNSINELGVFDSGEKGKEVLRVMKDLSLEDLIFLMQEGHSLEKVYGFWAFVKRENSDYRKYFPELVSDTSKVDIYQRGCLVQGPKEVGSYIFDIAEDLSGRYGASKIYPNYLDSMALELDFYWGILGNINCRLMNLEAPKNLYGKVKERAEKGDVPATIGLSSFQKKQDIPIIKEHLRPNVQSILYGLMCVERFPHEDFEEDVLTIFYSKMNQKHPLIFNYVCEILRKYKTPKVEKAFEELISNPDKYYFQIIGLWYSFEKNKEYEHPIRKNLIDKLGMKEIERRQTEYMKMNYWKIARKENKN